MVVKYIHSIRSIGIIALILLSVVAKGQTVQVEAPQTVEVGRPFSVEYKVNGTSRGISVAKEPQAQGLELLYGPALSQSSHVNIVNGQVNSQSATTVTYTFIAERSGKYTISGFEIELGGRSIPARSVTITATGSAPHGSSARGRVQQRQISAPKFMYRAIVPRTMVYEQEALPLTYKVYSSTQLNIVDRKPTSYDGIVSQDLMKDNHIYTNSEVIDGTAYQSAEIIRELIFPQRAGSITIPSNELTVAYSLPDPEDPFMGQILERKLTSDPIMLQVKPLPQDGRPTDFSGAVGQFSARYEISSLQWKTNEAITLRLILEGNGNLKIAKIPVLQLPQAIEIYDPVEHVDQSYEGGKLRSKRTLEYSLIPRYTGHFTIPKLELSYFNPSTERYERTTAQAIPVNVVQGKVVASIADNALIQTSSEPDEFTPYGLISGEGKSDTPSRLWIYILVQVAILTLALIIYYLLRRRISERLDVVSFNASRASKVAHKRLSKAKQHLQANAQEAFLEELVRALWGYLGDKLKLPVSSLNRQNVSEHLRQRSISETLIQDLTATLDDAEYARYTPQGMRDDTLSILYERTVKVIIQLENNSLA